MPRAARPKRSAGSTTSLGASFVAVALAVTAPFLILVGYLAYGEVAGARQRVQQDAMARATALGALVERHIAARVDGLTAMAVQAAAGSGAAVIDAQGRRLRQTLPDLERISLIDELGTVLATNPAGDGRRPSVGDQEWFKRAATSSEPFLGGGRLSGPEVIVGVYAPVRSQEGHFRGVLWAELSLRRVQELLGQAPLATGGVAELLDERAVLVARHPALYLLRDLQGQGGFRDLVRKQGGTGELVFEDGETRLVGAVPVPPGGWVLVVGLPSAQGLGDARRRLGQVGAAAAALAVLGVAAAVAVGRRHARGAERLRVAMRRLESGDMPAGLPVTVGGDIGALTEGFNRMLAWLHGKMREYEALSQVEEAAGAVVARDRSVDDILPGLLRKVVGGMGADAGALLLREGNDLVTRAAVGFHGIETEGVKPRRGHGLAWSVMADRGVVAIADAEGDYRLEEPYLQAAGLRSVIGVPITLVDDIVGVMVMGYRAPHGFGDAEVQRLEAMARRTAQALEHARALDAVRQNTAGLEAQVAEQLAALQQASREQVESRRQVQEARRQAQELEQAMKVQAEKPPQVEVQVKEVIVEREVVRVDPSGPGGAALRAEMLKTVSEELRAPLGALLDLPRLLVEGLDKPLGQEERQQLEILRDRGEEILELIDSLVVLSGLEAGQVKIVKAAFDLPTLIHRVVRSLQPRAAAKGNRIDADIKLHVGQVVSDSRRVEQILTNLLVTAVKYTEVGEIRVTCDLRDADIVLTVADDGAGFTPDEVARAFGPFLSIAPRDGRRLPGPGLLLTVCRRLTEALGGRIRVESEVDRGTWFTITLPAQS